MGPMEHHDEHPELEGGPEGRPGEGPVAPAEPKAADLAALSKKELKDQLHEAVGVVPPQGSGPGIGTVVGETLRGYMLNEEVLRPAQVVVVGEAAEEKAGR